jgi:acetyltransferase-like isoleucine patch superfamily enzyme
MRKGELSFIGIDSTIIQGVKVGKNVTISAGSVVIKYIPDNAVVVGNPGKVIKNKC